MANITLAGKVAVVGGGGKNLGGLIARKLAEHGAKVAVHFNSEASIAAAEVVVASVRRGGGSAFSLQGDLTRVASVRQLFDATVRHYGGVDIAINTTGLVIKKAFVDIAEDEYDQIFAINSKAAFFFMQEAGRRLNDRGRICTIVTSLLAAFTGQYSIYAGSKAAVEHFTRAASKEFGARGISVTAVAPGPMETPFFYGQETKESAAYNQSAADLSKFTRTGLTDIEDIAALALFLVTEGWWITGQTLFANGGYTTR